MYYNMHIRLAWRNGKDFSFKFPVKERRLQKNLIAALSKVGG